MAISDDQPISVGNLKALIPKIIAGGGRSLMDTGAAKLTLDTRRFTAYQRLTM